MRSARSNLRGYIYHKTHQEWIKYQNIVILKLSNTSIGIGKSATPKNTLAKNTPSSIRFRSWLSQKSQSSLMLGWAYSRQVSSDGHMYSRNLMMKFYLDCKRKLRDMFFIKAVYITPRPLSYSKFHTRTCTATQFT